MDGTQFSVLNFLGLENIPEGRLNIETENNVENHPTGRKINNRRNQNHRAGGFQNHHSKNERPTTSNRNINQRNSNRAGKDFSSAEHDRRKRNFRGDDNWSWRKKTTRFSPKGNVDENDSSGAESTISMSSTFSVPSYSRSKTKQPIRSNEKEQTHWRDRKFESTEKPIDRTVSMSSTFSGPSYSRSKTKQPIRSNEKELTHWRDRKFESTEKPVDCAGKSYIREERGQFNRPDKPNKQDLQDKFKRSEKPGREKFIGYKYLKALSEKEPHEMIVEILREKADINFVLNQKELPADWIMLIMETIRKLCESDFKSNRVQVLQYFCESPLLDHISHYLGETGMEKSENTKKNLHSFLSDLVVFYSTVISTIPTVALEKDFEKFLTKTKISTDLIKLYLNIEIDATIVEKLENLKKILEDENNIRDKKMEKPRRKYIEIIGDVPPPDNFRDLSLYPTEEDLNRYDFGFIRPNKIKGSYEDVNHYLDVQFRLIREDFIDPLRRGLRNYKEALALCGKPKYKYESVRLYPDTRIENIEVTKQNQVAYVVNFNVNRKLNIKWEYSKRFMFGSLLLFTRDNFESFFFATVFNREVERLKKGHILITLIGNEPLEPEMFDKPFVMAESEVYFEPYFLVMKALQEYNEDNFPMKKFIVDGNTITNLPRYIERAPNFYIYDYIVDLVLDIRWPHHSIIGFDEHQFNAFRTAFTSNFTVIQGPPGTGKTYLGLKIVEVLLNNLKMNGDIFRTPILLVCYTNHALDQFLEGILKFTRSIVRVGGQSKSDVLKPYNLRGRENISNLRREARKLYPAMNRCRDEMKKILFQLKQKNEAKKLVEMPEGILSYNVLKDVMKAEYKQTIPNEETLLRWLLDTNVDSTVGQNNPEEKTTKNIDADFSEPIEIDDEIYFEDEDEMEANVLINEDDIFDDQEVKPNDISVKYCFSMEDAEQSVLDTAKKLQNLRGGKSQFDVYYNLKYQLNDALKTVQLRRDILDYYLQNSKLDSFTKFNTRNQNLLEMSLDQRWNLYWNWVSQVKENLVKELKNLEADHRAKSQQYEEFKQLEDFHVVKKSLVVGMTTTCAARLQLLLKTLSPAIVIVEEAAEVLEAHIVVSLSKNCEQVILIGDHKQLKPSAAVYELSRKYNINVSLFERMINNNMYCPQLQIQHRMRPEISSLIAPSIYPDLKNHASVLNYPSVKGITKNLFFVEHNVLEENVDDSSSRKNKFEAEFMIQLCRYILLQGYSSEQITILTTYTGQMFHLREMKRDHSIMRNVKVIVVDKYQGEENDIILLSLVRSNEERKIGFLSIENRVCVALSRAKIGLYIIGNMDILSDSALWKNIKEKLIERKAIGPKLTLYCDKHDVYTRVSCKLDFSNVLEGGCNNYCHEVMDCGHKCQLLCHKIDMEHLEKTCREKCLKQCVENHPCKKYCFEDCGQCTVPVERTLPCGHVLTLSCFRDYQTYPCPVEVSVVLERCSHEVKKKCYLPLEEVKCTFPCEDRLECGHQCVRNCHKTDDPDHLKYKCHKPCDKINRGCSMAHKCEKLCFEDCGKCKVRIDIKLPCNHITKLPCSTDREKINCDKPCSRKCSECNGVCPKKCHEDCKPCMNKVTKRIPDCGHEIEINCSVVPERKLCRKKCQRIAPCGHECKSLCSKICGDERCWIIGKSNHVRALCGHGFANVPCWRRNESAIDAEELLQYCSEPCTGVLKCGDLCTGTCGSCWQGRLHRTCKEQCGHVLVCGHSCTFPCRKACPPCTKKCQYACKHSKCNKDCGVPCVECKENCEWKCEHLKCKRKCGAICDRKPCYEPCRKKLRCDHDCIGFCGEPCPPKCRICDKDEVTEIVFGDEDEENARFVLLVDCGHFIESNAMDRFISMPAEKGEIVMKVCPMCKTPISKTLRYMNEVKKVYRDIQNVKKKIYGDEKEMKEIRLDLVRKLRELDLKNDQLRNKELHLISETVNMFNGRLENRGKRSHLSKADLKSMHFFVDMFASIISRLNELKECPERDKLRIYKRLAFILKRLEPKVLIISKQQVDDTARELDRYHRMVDYHVFLNKPEFSSNRNLPIVIRINADIVGILYGLKCFDDEQNTRIDALFKKLQKEMKSIHPLSPEEKRMIHAAMSKDFYGGIDKQGHWFQCTNGHYYCITECGGAMEESNCPECGEKIGGRDHRYVPTVRVASDMDGATRPAWSSNNNIGNFVLD